MKVFMFLLIQATSTAFAHCPIEIEAQGEQYCMNYEWLNTDKKVQGNFVETENESPYLVASNELPPKWLFSKLEVKTWKKGDSNHIPVEIKDFVVFPYMTMEMDHNHSTLFDFSYDSTSYILSQVRFQDMKGCWSLRWSTSDKLDVDSSKSVFANSQWFTNVTEYTNSSEDKILSIEEMCSKVGNGSGSDDGGGHHHDH